MQKQFQLGQWCFDKPAGEWDRIARKVTQQFEETSLPICCCLDPVSKGDLKSKKDKQNYHSQRTTLL